VTGPVEPAVAPEAGTEHLIGAAIPEIREISETRPVLVAAEPAKPWYRKVPGLAWAAIIAVVAGGVTAAVLVLAVFSIHPAAHPAVHPAPAPAAVSVPDAILAHDGYSGNESVSGSVWQQILSSSGGGSDAAAAKVMFSAASAGFKGHSTEIVVTLTPAGQQMLAALLPYAKPGDFGQGVTAHLTDGNRYLVVAGPQSTLGGPSDLQTS
jgi:hypothetical protein